MQIWKSVGDLDRHASVSADAWTDFGRILPAPAGFRRGAGGEEKAVEKRPYFVMGDLIANLSAGALVGAIAVQSMGPSWNMWISMCVGMVAGMLLSMLVAFPAMALFGAMEVMLPVMLTGMVAGMVVSMMAAMDSLPIARGVVWGAVCGVLTLAACYLANAWIGKRGIS